MKVVIFKDHHGEVYMDASTPVAFAASCLQRVRDMYGPDADLVDGLEEPKEPDTGLTLDQLKALPDGSVKRAGLEEWRLHRRRLGEHLAARQFWSFVDGALKENDGHAAVDAVDLARDVRGDDYRVVDVWTPPAGAGTPLTLEFAGIQEIDVPIYCQGVTDTLDRLGLGCDYDETSPPDEKGECTYRVVDVGPTTDQELPEA